MYSLVTVQNMTMKSRIHGRHSGYLLDNPRLIKKESLLFCKLPD